MKKCSNCGAEKPLSDYQKRKASRDGLTASCKACLKERDRIRDQNPERKLIKEIYVKGKGKDVANASKKRCMKKNPKKRSVHITTGNAIRDGKLFKSPCEVCGSTPVEAHHCDYNKPLEVIWLCPTHHEEWHRENGPGLNGD